MPTRVARDVSGGQRGDDVSGGGSGTTGNTGILVERAARCGRLSLALSIVLGFFIQRHTLEGSKFCQSICQVSIQGKHPTCTRIPTRITIRPVRSSMHASTQLQICVHVVHRKSSTDPYSLGSIMRSVCRELLHSLCGQPMRCGTGYIVSFRSTVGNLHACPSSRSHSGVSGRRASRGAGARAFGYSHAALQQCPRPRTTTRGRRAWRTLRRRARRARNAR